MSLCLQFYSTGEVIECDFIDGLEVVAGAGNPACKEGLCIYNYTANKSMTHRYLLWDSYRNYVILRKK